MTPAGRVPWLATLAVALATVTASGDDPSLPPTRVAEGVYVGALPDLDTWQALEALGVQTAVGVDGLPPDAATARRHGIRVVHIPIGYDGIPKSAARQLTTVATQLPRPVYVYCHHGRHRGPAAAAIVCRAAGLLNQGGANDLLNTAGTGRQYMGLWRDVLGFETPPADAELPPVTERSEVSPLRLAMSQLDRAWSKRLAAASTLERDESHLLVLEAFKESRRAALADAESPTTMIELLNESIDAWPLTKDMTRPQDIKRFETASCLSCHKNFRH